MLSQKNKEDVADLILNYCWGASKTTIESLIDSILSVFLCFPGSICNEDRTKIKHLLLDYRAGNDLLENTIDKIHKIIDNQTLLTQHNINLAPFGVSSNSFSFPHPNLSLLLLQHITTKQELYDVLTHLVDPQFIYTYDLGHVGNGSWYNVEIVACQTLILFTYHISDHTKHLSPEEFALGFIAEAFHSWATASQYLVYDIYSGKFRSK